MRRLNRSGIIKAAAAVWAFSVVARTVIAIVAARHGRPVALYLAQATVFRFDAIAVGLALSASGIRCEARASYWPSSLRATILTRRQDGPGMA